MKSLDTAKQKFIDPQAVIGQLGISQGTKVADFGCGSGYFTTAFAKVIGDDGIVYALDVLPQRLEAVESQARILGLNNIVTKRVNLEKAGGSGLTDESVDWAVMKDVLFQNQDKGGMLAEAKRILKKNGKALVIEWDKNGASIGPEEKTRLSNEEILKIAEKDGWEILKEIEVGDFHYGLIFNK